MNRRLFFAVVATQLFQQIAISIARVTASYRAVELDISIVVVGFLTAVFALVPIFGAIKVGRLIDRGRETQTAWLGAVFLVAGCSAFLNAISVTWLFIATALLGISHFLLAVSLQVACSRLYQPRAVERLLASYLIAGTVGPGLGPYIVGWFGGSMHIPPTQQLFWVGLCAALVALICALILPKDRSSVPASKKSSVMSLRDVMRSPQQLPSFLVSAITSTSQDLAIVYLPLMAAERGIAAAHVGNLLLVRAGSSVLSQLAFVRLSEMVGTQRLMMMATLINAMLFILMALPLTVGFLYPVIAGAGLAFGLAMTASIATVLTTSDAQFRGIANSMRVMGNRIGQVAIPLVATAFASSVGVSGIFFVVGAAFGSVWFSVQTRNFTARRGGDR